MSRNANPSTDTHDAVRIATLAVELGEPVEVIERELAGHIFRVAGFRCCPGSVAASLIAAHERRKVEAEADAQRRAEEEQARHEAMRQRARAERDDTSPRVQQFGLAITTVTPEDEGVLPVVAMTARAKAEFDGATMTRRPSRLDWQLGQAEGGGSIGPSWQQIKADAAARAAERAAKKAGGK